jgi:hypothetical protein
LLTLKHRRPLALMRIVDIIDGIQRMDGASITQYADIVQQRGAKMVC